MPSEEDSGVGPLMVKLFFRYAPSGTGIPASCSSGSWMWQVFVLYILSVVLLTLLVSLSQKLKW
jgi:hypothetical protein